MNSTLRYLLIYIFNMMLNIRTNLLVFFTVVSFVHIGFVQTARAEDVLDSILDKLKNLTCETQGIGNLLRSEFTHTCIPAPFFTFAIANIVSPGLYANTFLRVAINDKELFGDACARESRLDFHDPKLSFGLCNNRLLATQRVKAIAQTGVAIGKSIFSHKDPWNDIKDAWKIPKKDYYEMHRNTREGESGTMVDIGIIPVFPWKVIKEKDKMCVATQSFGGWIPIGCTYIKEPYPVSIYSDFLDVSPEGQGELAKLTSLTSCGNMGGCYKRAYDNSKASIVMTGPIIECVKEMIAKLMISTAVCGFDDVDKVLNSNSRTTSSLYIFQKKMHITVSALLTLYVIFFGFKIVLSGQAPPKAEIVNFVIKFIFVVYFSVGININSG